MQVVLIDIEIDFFSHNDHAEALIPEHWAATKQAVRDCNDRSGPADNQDLMPWPDSSHVAQSLEGGDRGRG